MLLDLFLLKLFLFDLHLDLGLHRGLLFDPSGGDRDEVSIEEGQIGGFNVFKLELGAWLDRPDIVRKPVSSRPHVSQFVRCWHKLALLPGLIVSRVLSLHELLEGIVSMVRIIKVLVLVKDQSNTSGPGTIGLLQGGGRVELVLGTLEQN